VRGIRTPDPLLPKRILPISTICYGVPWLRKDEAYRGFYLPPIAALYHRFTQQRRKKLTQNPPEDTPSFNDFGVTSLELRNVQGWIIFCSEVPGTGHGGSFLAVQGQANGSTYISNLTNVKKVNSAPLGLGDGNWNDEIQSWSLANNPPTINVTKADGITIYRSDGSISSGGGG
jgi:hypothetical protein